MSITPTEKKGKKRRIRLVLAILILLIISLGIDLYRSNNCIKITTFTLESKKVTSGVRVGVISDLHGKVFGKDNDVLFEKIKAGKAHIVLVDGDMISGDKTSKEDIAAFSDFITELCDIAPVYYAIGNHERFHPEYDRLYEIIRAAGATLLIDEYRDLNIAGTNVRLGGISYYRSWDKEANTYIKDFSSTDDYKILMCHHPEFYDWGIKNYSIDLTVSGHTHGGMVKLPILGPLYAPEQGWFPKYGAGLYEEENGCLAVTTGLASSPSYLPRVFNRPEIMFIDLK